MTTSPTTRQNQPNNTPRHWKVHIGALQQSGLSRAEYCRQHKLSYHTLTYWQRKLSKTQVTSNETTLVPVPFKAIINHHSVEPARAALKIILSDKIAVEVGENFSSATLVRLLTALEHR